MIDSQIHVAIRSYSRPGRVSTIEVVPFAWIWVPESQGEEYRQHYGDRVITIPDEEDGNTSRKFNAILQRTPNPWTLILDDDIRRIGYWEAGDHFWLDSDGLREMIVHHFVLAYDLGVHLWGIQQNKDELGHYTYRPFSLLAPILGPFTGHLEPRLRFDENVPMHEDYDFWLQNIRIHRMTLRANKYHYVCDHGKLAGGAVGQRTMESQLRTNARMKQKWGDKLFRVGGSAGGRLATGRNILNSKLRVPIPGC